MKTIEKENILAIAPIRVRGFYLARLYPEKGTGASGLTRKRDLPFPPQQGSIRLCLCPIPQQ